MLDDKDVLKTCWYWARRLKNPHVSFDELVSVGYEVGKKLDNPKLLQKWIKYTMLKYIKNAAKTVIESDKIDIIDESFDFVAHAEESEELEAVIDAACDEREKKIIRMRFWRGMKIKEIALAMGVTKQAICWSIKQALNRMRVFYERRRTRAGR